MDFKDNNPPVNSPQILPFPPKKQPSKLPIYIGDEKARQLYLQYKPLVKSVCMRILRNKEDAEDMAQEVFADVLEKLKENEHFSIQKPKSFFPKAAKNMSINRKKREQARVRKESEAIFIMAAYASLKWFIDRTDEEGKVKWEAGLVDNGYDQIEAEIIVKAILDEQDEKNRKMLFLKYYHDMTGIQIGNAVGLVESTVSERLTALEKKIRLKMGRLE